jgi:hypothetical protein
VIAEEPGGNHADAVLDNHRHGLPVIQWRAGCVVATPSGELLSTARHILATNGETTSGGPAQ